MPNYTYTRNKDVYHHSFANICSLLDQVILPSLLDSFIPNIGHLLIPPIIRMSIIRLLLTLPNIVLRPRKLSIPNLALRVHISQNNTGTLFAHAGDQIAVLAVDLGQIRGNLLIVRWDQRRQHDGGVARVVVLQDIVDEGPHALAGVRDADVLETVVGSRVDEDHVGFVFQRVVRGGFDLVDDVSGFCFDVLVCGQLTGIVRMG